MSKLVRSITLVALVAMFALVLAACGDPTATTAPAPAPTTAVNNTGSNTTAAATAASGNASGGSNFFVLSGASATNVPDALKAALSQYESQYPGAKAQAYKISEQSAKVKDMLAEAFKKEGWQNVTPNVPDTGNGFALGFTKSNKGAAAVAFPGAVAGLGASDLIYIVFLPQ